MKTIHNLLNMGLGGLLMTQIILFTLLLEGDNVFLVLTLLFIVEVLVVVADYRIVVSNMLSLVLPIMFSVLLVVKTIVVCCCLLLMK